MSEIEAAKELLVFAGGPPFISALILYIMKGFSGPERTARKGWRALGGGILVFSWYGLFIYMASPIVVQSWKIGGSLQPSLVTLSAAWLGSIALELFLTSRLRSACRNIIKPFHPDAKDNPRWVGVLRSIGDCKWIPDSSGEKEPHP